MDLSLIELNAHYSKLQNLHIKWKGQEIAIFERLHSHGSERLIVRLVSEDNTSSIGIVSNNLAENKAFINFGRHFRDKGLNVPEIYITDASFDSYILEDLNDETLFNRISDGSEFNVTKVSLYKKVIEELPKFQITAGKEIDFSYCYQFNKFGEENIKFDLEYFKKRFLNNFYKGAADIDKLNNDLNFLKEKITELPRQFFLYRDFQSRNVMLRENIPWFIDFQSGRKGALLYDIASLLYDAKADIPQNIREILLEYYLEIIQQYGIKNTGMLGYQFWYFAVIRILQAMGAYGYLGIVKGKQRFLESIPYALKNINFILNSRIEGNELLYLKKLFKEMLDSKTIK